MTTSLGIDVGSVAVKAVVMADDRPVKWRVEATRPDIAAQCTMIVGELCGVEGTICATGYGRNLVAEATMRTSEIMANATAAGWLPAPQGYRKLANAVHLRKQSLRRPCHLSFHPHNFLLL